MRFIWPLNWNISQPLFPIQFREVEACKYQIIVERLPPNKILLRFSRNFSCTRSSFEFNFDFGRNRPIKITLFIHCQKIIEIPHSYLIHRSFSFKLKYIESDIFRRNIISAKWPPLASLQTSTSLLKVLLAFWHNLDSIVLMARIIRSFSLEISCVLFLFT